MEFFYGAGTMGLIKRADIDDYARESYVMNLSDLEMRGRALVEDANAKREQILSDARTQREQLISSAVEVGQTQGFKEGFEQGHLEGIAKGIEEARQKHEEMLTQLSEMWIAQLDAFENNRNTMLQQARTQIVELGAMIASRVTRRVIELEPTVVLAQMEAVLSGVTESTRLVLDVHPDDVELAQSELPEMLNRFSTCEHAQVVTDASLERGSCRARSPSGGIIDASITTQLDRIIDALLPDTQHPEPELPSVPEKIRIDDLGANSLDDEPKTDQGDAA